MSVREIPLEKLRTSPFNPRITFSGLEEMAETMDQPMGVIEPITIRPLPGVEGEYEIVVGERRVRAAKKAKRKTIPAVIKKLSDDEVMRMQIVENLQREDLTPAEEGKLFQELQTKFGHSGASIARMIGRDPSYVTERIQLLDLPQEIMTRVTMAPGAEAEPTTMTFSKARALIPLEPEKQIILAKKITEKGMTSVQVEGAVRKAEEIETMIAMVKRPALREQLERKYLSRVFEEDVTPTAVKTEIDLALGKPIGPSLEEQWRDVVSQVWALRRPYMENSFVREWRSEDRRFIQATIWMDVGMKIPSLEREDHRESEFKNFQEADKYAEAHGGYCSGIIEMAGGRYWCIFVKKTKTKAA